MLTEQCRNEGTNSPCDQTNLGAMSFNATSSFIPRKSIHIGSSPGHMIGKDIDPRKFTYIDLETDAADRRRLRAQATADGEDLPLSMRDHFLVKLYIYCASCACQVATALDICDAVRGFPYLDIRIRPDYRQYTNCSIWSSRIDGISSLIDFIKVQESKDSLHLNENLKVLDRQWMEQVVYNYEGDNQIAAADPLSHIAKSHKSKDGASCAAIVVLGEADYCISLMRAAPFPRLRLEKVRETQLYRHKQELEEGAWFWRRYYMGDYAPKEPLEKKRPAPSAQDTGANINELEPGPKRAATSSVGA